MWDFDQEMEVVAHEAVGEDANLTKGFILA